MKKAVRFTDGTNIRLGFEVECYVKSKHAKTFESLVFAEHSGVVFDDDGSIEPPWDREYENEDDGGYKTFELQTPVLPPGSALRLLDKIFYYLRKYGGTNESCGLHVNISSTNKKRMKRFNPLPFIVNPMWEKLLKDFGREDNDYCLPICRLEKNKSPMALVESGFLNGDGDYCGSGFDKDSCINMSHWYGGERLDSRIEIRGPGGDKYHRRFRVVSHYVKKIIKLFVLCCDKAPLVKFRV